MDLYLDLDHHRVSLVSLEPMRMYQIVDLYSFESTWYMRKKQPDAENYHLPK
jgi:hypothetical protein